MRLGVPRTSTHLGTKHHPFVTPGILLFRVTRQIDIGMLRRGACSSDLCYEVFSESLEDGSLQEEAAELGRNSSAAEGLHLDERSSAQV